MNKPTPAEVAAALKDYGTDFQTYKGWDRAGSSNDCKGVLLHHTATSSASLDNPAPTLGWCVSAYDKPVANALIGKKAGYTYLFAAMNGAAYHCGEGGPWPWAGIPQGNRPDLLWGIEIDDPGVKATLTDYQVDNAAKMVAGLWDVFGWTDDRSIGTHKCWTDGCHGENTTASPNLGRKNDTLDGPWGSWPGSNKPEPFNAPFWREKVAAELSGGAAAQWWDGTIPTRSAATVALEDEKSNQAAYRLACRLFDLGYKPKEPRAEFSQQYPLNSMQAAQEAWGWSNNHGHPSEKTWRHLFGVDKP